MGSSLEEAAQYPLPDMLYLQRRDAEEHLWTVPMAAHLQVEESVLQESIAPGAPVHPDRMFQN